MGVSEQQIVAEYGKVRAWSRRFWRELDGQRVGITEDEAESEGLAALVEALLELTTHTITVAGIDFVVSGAHAPREASLRELFGDALLHIARGLPDLQQPVMRIGGDGIGIYARARIRLRREDFRDGGLIHHLPPTGEPLFR